MKLYTRWNNAIGWLIWIIASYVFLSTAEPTASWWDCGEYISTAFKLQVGHPPGAPTFQLLGAIFSIFAFGDVSNVGFMVNAMSALSSSFTILFLFWTITLLAKKIIFHIHKLQSDEELTLGHKFTIFGSAIVGSLAYTFSDSFWFSAVEGEVYAMSSFFTAISFWAILKWEAAADKPHHLRWIVFIAFLVGLAIGVHLLNLLVIPAVVYTIYYKKFKTSRAGFWKAAGISGLLLGIILWGIVPYIVDLAGMFELFFVNTLGLPFNVGTLVYFALLIGVIVWGIRYAIKKNKVVLHTAVLCFTFILIGYSTFFILVIRSNAGVPINENEPKNALSLLSYLNREQYGTRPLIYGQYFNAPMIEVNEANPKYNRNDETGVYDLVGHGQPDVKFDPAFCGLFPRMHSNSDAGGRKHITYYKFWSGTDGLKKPTTVENMRFLFRYHFNWMYFRYFMWNFSGRQNNIQGLGYNPDGSVDLLHGNWLTGIKFIDEARLGPQSNLPDFLKDNPSRNYFYALPLLLGLLGIWYQYKKNKKDSFIVFLLFFMTGLAIILYLNQPSTEPRERDYAYAGSFYAFAIWIGLGVMALADFMSKYMKQVVAASVATLATLVLVPGIMAKEGWDDHDRSNKYAARDFARNMLEACEPNAILITNGDNDTFPLWYCQEVEGIRTDVRVINSMLANSNWHIQPLFKKVYNSKPLNFSVSYNDYGQGKNDQVMIQDQFKEYLELSDVLNFVASSNPATKLTNQRNGDVYSYFPSRKIKMTIPKDSLLAKGIITPEQMENVPPYFSWELSGNSITKSDLAILDILASNKWERPIYLASPYGQRNIMPTTTFAENVGSVWYFAPYYNPNRVVFGNKDNGFNTDKSYDLYVNKYTWGRVNENKTTIDPETSAFSEQARYQHGLLAMALFAEGKNDSAVKVLDKGLKNFPHHKIPFGGGMAVYADIYFKLGQIEKAMNISQQMIEIYKQKLDYFAQFPRSRQNSLGMEKREALDGLQDFAGVLSRYGKEAEASKIAELIQKY